MITLNTNQYNLIRTAYFLALKRWGLPHLSLICCPDDTKLSRFEQTFRVYDSPIQDKVIRLEVDEETAGLMICWLMEFVSMIELMDPDDAEIAGITTRKIYALRRKFKKYRIENIG